MAVDQSGMPDLHAFLVEWTRKHVPAGSLEEVEAAALEVSQVVGEVVAETALAQSARASYRACSLPCVCGRRAKFMGYRPKTLVTRVGAVVVRRPYYYCTACGWSSVPWDAAQGLSERCYTPRVKAMVCRTAARLSYQDTVELIGELTPVRLAPSAAEWIVKEVGGRVRDEQGQATEEYLSGLVSLAEAPSVERLYVTMDGSHAHIDGQWHEVKTGAVYEARPGDDPPPGEARVDTSGPKRYVSAQEPAEAFTARLYVEALQAGVHRAGEVVVLGDGADWIWNHAAGHYPQATEIVDYWHACEHIWDLARVQYGDTSPQGARWAREHCARLKQHGPARLLRALRRLKPRSAEAAEKRRTEHAYFAGNAARMRYPEFRQRGLMIGSGIAEAACKVVVGQRLKHSGMRWKHHGADHILALRCLLLNNQQDDIHRLAKAA